MTEFNLEGSLFSVTNLTPNIKILNKSKHLRDSLKGIMIILFLYKFN